MGKCAVAFAIGTTVIYLAVKLAVENAYHSKGAEVYTDIFNHGLCLPFDNKMTAGQEDVIIDSIYRCFR